MELLSSDELFSIIYSSLYVFYQYPNIAAQHVSQKKIKLDRKIIEKIMKNDSLEKQNILFFIEETECLLSKGIPA